MVKARLTSKGQVTIPKSVRHRLGLKAGDEIDFVEDRAGFRLQKRIAESPFTRYRGFLKDLAGHDPDSLIDELRAR
jgi:AbrB family looped-hinge helix DNA binding protein